MVYNRSAVPKLYLVATPIGNLEDVSQRAIRILGEVGLIAAEDTRRTRRLLAAHGVKTPLTSYHEYNSKSKLPHLIERLAKDDIALVSDAGMPGISDPGYDLVRAAIERQIPIIPVPGPSVLTTALAVSGLPASQFLSLGFLPRRTGQRRRLLESIAAEPRTIVAFEVPHRLQASLSDILETLGDRRISVCRELTKVHEEVFRGTVSGAIEHFAQPKGEFTLVIAGIGRVSKSVEVTDGVREELVRLRAEGVTARDAVAELASMTNISRRALYKAWLELE